jgi:acyl-coenzyme A synthetase/AMP-(fatty) acid ligase
MENKPEYIATWLGLSKLGVISALINTNLKNQALVHSITVSNSKVIVFGAELNDGLLKSFILIKLYFNQFKLLMK